MEFLLLIGIVIVILMLNKSNNSVNERFDNLQANFDTLFSEQRRLENKIKSLEMSSTQHREEPPQVNYAFEIAEKEVKLADEIATQPIEIPTPVPPTVLPVVPTVTEPTEPAPVYQPSEELPEKVSFWERYPDLEKFIGENLVNKIGIAILVLGMGFFLKYAIDQNWINEIGRTCIGLVTGGVLIGIAHKMRKAYPAFCSVLIGGGLAILYFSVTIAYHQYHLIGQTTAFIVMIGITAATVVLSVLYDRIELAVFAILGGFGAPFLVSSGDGNFVVLFTYLLTLNTGMLVLSYYKKWNLLNQISFVLTVIIYGGWLYTIVLDPSITVPRPFVGALIFATLFYFIFFLMNIINNVKEKVAFSAVEIGQLLSNTALYFSAGMLILESVNDGIFKGSFTIFLALINFVFAFLLYKNQKVDRNLLYLLIGLVLTFVSLAAPIQLDGNYITLFWALESVLLVWLAYKSGLGFLRDASVLLVGLMVVSLVMDWNNIYILGSRDTVTNVLFPVFNKGFITTFISIGGLVGYIHLMKTYFGCEKMLNFPVSGYVYFLNVGTVLLAYAGIMLELNHQAQAHFPNIKAIVLGCWNYIFAILLLYKSKKQVLGMQVAILVFSIALVVIYPFYFNSETIEIRDNYLLESTASLPEFFTHYILIVLMLVTLPRIYSILSPLVDRVNLKEGILVAIIMLLVYLASAELDHILVLSRFGPGNTVDTLLTVSHKAGYAILWGICSFVLIYLGMKWKSKTTRIASLALFGITLFKLFLFDIRDLSEGGKIAAFISLGITLLIVSFMYQKLKTIIIADELKVESGKHEQNPDQHNEK